MDRKANRSPLRYIIAVAVVAAASAGAGFIAGKNSVSVPASIVATEPSVPPSPPPIVADDTLGRADIIRLADMTADAASGGPAIEDPMDGRRFAIRIAFGCRLAEGGRDEGAAYTREDETLRVRVLPQDWTDIPWVAKELSQRGAIGAEGFWIPRPWTQAETCPPGGAEVSGPSSSLGIAQTFDSTSSRVQQRRGRALEATVQVAAADADFSKGLSLVIEGRVVRWPGGRDTILCRTAKPYERPVCVVGTELESVSIDNASSGERLSTWRF